MSKLVCNVAKFKSGQLYGMDIHIQRKTENHSNKDIDVSRSNLNYELVNGDKNEHYFTAVKNRIKQGYAGKKGLRKDATLACGVLISSDKAFFDGLTDTQERLFFQTAYEHLCDIYGKENIISAKVHKDETTPHLHAIVVPLTKDGRLTAKELFDRKALTNLHSEIPKKLKAKGFNIERGEKNSNSKRLETDEYKKLKEQNRVDVKINPDELMLYKIGEEKKFLRSVDILETQADVAKRLEKKYIEPLTEELTALRTEIAVKQQAEERQRYAKQFNNNVGEDDFKNLYYRVKSFGSNYVKNVFERVTQVIDQMNIEKQRQLTQEEQAKKKKLASQEEEKLVNLHGGRTGLYRILDFCDAPLEFKENGEKSFYVAVQSMTDNSKGVRWGMELKDRVKQLALKIGDFVRFNGDRIEKAQKIEQQHQRRGMRL